MSSPAIFLQNFKKNKNIFSLIFNTGTSDTSGLHFVALYVNARSIYYFDLFGDRPANKYIKDFIEGIRGRKRLIINRRKIQSMIVPFPDTFVLHSSHLETGRLNFTDILINLLPLSMTRRQ